MMKDWMEIGSSPADEDCAQVGIPGYAIRARAECRVYAEQLAAEFPAGRFAVKAFPHDFGTYYEVCAMLDDDDPEMTEAAYDAESSASPVWSADSRQKLNGAGIGFPAND